MRKLIGIVALAALLPAAAAASATHPQSGRFSGLIAGRPVNGFRDTVTFVVRPRSLVDFTFGTLGCFGYGNFPVGEDPFATSLAILRSVPLAANGTFGITSALARYNGGDPALKLYVTVSGRFTSRTSGSGTIWVSEIAGNGGKCGPQKLSFTVRPGTVSADGG